VRRLRLPLPLKIPDHTFNLDNWEESACLLKFRFTPSNVVVLAAQLGLPAIVRIDQGCRVCVPRVEALCVVLHRLAFPVRYGDMVSIFGRSIASLSTIVCGVIKFLDAR
jgi:hypothetical protein